YTVNPIEYTIDKIETELALRDIKGLTNNKIELINVVKEHPLVTLMANQINPEGNRAADYLRSGKLPAISVTPGSAPEEGFTLGQSPSSGLVDADFIEALQGFQNKTVREIQNDVLISKAQIETIIAAYRRIGTGKIFYNKTTWNQKDEVNISLWSETPDDDIRLGNVLSSTLSFLRGSVSDNSLIRFGEFRTTKGLTNFNYGRVLFGTEYSLTFVNTYSNYIVYTEQNISADSFSADFTYTVPGADDGTKLPE
ncbi:MAG: hypothetical protein WC900_05005, partial [Oscillospiraceae bacterium]